MSVGVGRRRKVMKTHRVTYELKGVRIIDVTTKAPLPDNWESLKTEEQDEWLYEHQEFSVLVNEDIEYGKASSIIELRRDLRTVS
jgi:hypothetical protein